MEKNYLLFGPTSYLQYNSFYYCRSSIKTPQGSLFIFNTFEGALNRNGGLINLAKTMVSVLHKKWKA